MTSLTVSLCFLRLNPQPGPRTLVATAEARVPAVRLAGECRAVCYPALRLDKGYLQNHPGSSYQKRSSL